MKKSINNLASKLVYALMFLVGVSAFALPSTPPGGGSETGTGLGGVTPGAIPDNPIDMYEGALLMVAVVMMVGYYLYTRNRKAIA